ncbi:protoporphyrinogen/coproporphyrinogen oxidase [Demequina muriae]|uniref:FAD-dependent oxidoreductase n=1 Tax=Demequina muriae TaxID=3051664 RepID=A0ABT8GFI8_9MICO|nr:FAD-dependent oxidoreductase [Demequina sp. EGI L300058]MDN4480034.1 FAD-dependent oxidoreductase [Demequina sp. EGI L300058]
MAEQQRWIVVGGGVGGLLAARRLASAGHDVTVMEADDHPGGRISRVTVDGLALDAGAESFATRGGHVAALLSELGLAESIVFPERRPAWVVTSEAAYPLPATGWLGVPTTVFTRELRRALGWRGTARLLSDRFTRVRDVDDSTSLGELARDRLGDRATERLVAPVVQGIYSRPLDDIALGDVAPGLAAEVVRKGGLVRAAAARRAASPAGSAVQGLVGGMATLIDALAADARSRGAEIALETPVGALEKAGSGWTVWSGGTSHRADGVVLAVPRPVVSALVPHVAWAEDRQVAIVTLVLDAPELDSAPRGTGVLAVGNVSGAKALTHSTAKWRWLADRTGGRHVVRLSYGIDNARDARAHALSDASTLLGVALKEAQVRDIERVQWADSAPAAVEDREPVPGLHLVGSAAGLSGIAAIVAADAGSRLGEPAPQS